MNDSISKGTLERIYGLLRYTGKNNFTMPDTSAPPYSMFAPIDRRNAELVEAPDVVERDGRGSCYDQTFLVKKWLDAEGVESRVFYSISDNVRRINMLKSWYYTADVLSHCFIMCHAWGKWKWIEWSWHANINNSVELDTLEGALDEYRRIAERSWHMPIRLTEVTDGVVSLPQPRLDFMNACVGKWAAERTAAAQASGAVAI